MSLNARHQNYSERRKKAGQERKVSLRQILKDAMASVNSFPFLTGNRKCVYILVSKSELLFLVCKHIKLFKTSLCLIILRIYYYNLEHNYTSEIILLYFDVKNLNFLYQRDDKITC